MIKFKYAEAPLRELGEIAEMMSGMSGVSNKWASDGNCKFIDYLNVYTHHKVDVSLVHNATVKSFRQKILQKGDMD